MKRKTNAIVGRLAGLFVLILGIITLAFGLLAGGGLAARLFEGAAEGLLSLAIFFALLSGLGILVTSTGFNLLSARRRLSSRALVAWQPLVVSGGLIVVSMAIFTGYSVWLGQPLPGAATKGVSLLTGLGLAFFCSGLYRRKKR